MTTRINSIAEQLAQPLVLKSRPGRYNEKLEIWLGDGSSPLSAEATWDYYYTSTTTTTATSDYCSCAGDPEYDHHYLWGGTDTHC